MCISKQAALAIAGVFGACIGAISPAAAQPAPQEQSAQPAPAPPAQPAAQPAPPAQPRLLTSSYRVNPGDELEVYVWGEERLQRTVRVLPDGTFAFPLVGQVMAQGRLPQELEKTISEQLRDQYRGQVPQVTVSVKAPSGLQFSIIGKIKSPGTFTPGRYVTILEALSLAGGPAEFANLDAVLVIRKHGDQLSTMRFRLSSLFRSGAGDAEVDRANLRRWGDYSQTSVDPCDDMTMWTTQEFTANTNTWGVAVARVSAPPPARPEVAVPATVPDGQDAVDVKLTARASSDAGFFDPGAGWPPGNVAKGRSC